MDCSAALVSWYTGPDGQPIQSTVERKPCALAADHEGKHVSADGAERWRDAE